MNKEITEEILDYLRKSKYFLEYEKISFPMEVNTLFLFFVWFNWSLNIQEPTIDHKILYASVFLIGIISLFYFIRSYSIKKSTLDKKIAIEAKEIEKDLTINNKIFYGEGNFTETQQLYVIISIKKQSVLLQNVNDNVKNSHKAYEEVPLRKLISNYIKI